MYKARAVLLAIFVWLPVFSTTAESISIPDWKYPLVHNDKKFAIFWTPRCGCTTTKWWFSTLLGYNQKEIIEQYGNVHSFYSNVLRNTCNVQLALSNPELFTKIAIVRNPYDRLISSFRWAIETPNEFSKAMMIKYNLNSQQELFSTVTFLDFIRFLENEAIDGFYTNTHWSGQTDPRYWDLIDHVVHLENFEEELTHVCELLGVDPENPYLHIKCNARSRTDDDFGTTLETLTWSQLMQLLSTKEGTIAWPHYKFFIPPGVKARVDKIYERDIRLLGYEF